MADHWQKRTAYRAESANRPSREELVARLASRQRQLLRAEQLHQLGFTKGGLQRRVKTRRLFRLHASVYAIHPPPYSRHQHYLAAVYACGEGSVLTGIPSAWLYGLLETAPLVAEVNNPSGRGRSRPGINVHRRAIAERDLCSRHGIPTTSVARTILDCSATLGGEGTEDLIMAADSMNLLNRRRLEELTVEHAGRPGVRHILSLIAATPRELRSKNERRMFRICREFEIPIPLTNHGIETAGRTFYADFLWPDLNLIVEADSWRWHGGRQANEDDKDRDQLLMIAGYSVVHFTRDQILRSSAETGRRLRALTGG